MNIWKKIILYSPESAAIFIELASAVLLAVRRARLTTQRVAINFLCTQPVDLFSYRTVLIE